MAGEFSGSLDNIGERLQLVNASGAVISDFTFADIEPWPTQPDGLGQSLVLRRPGLDPSLPQNWRASVTANPGTTDAITYAAWKTTNSISSDSADDDNDGLTNFAEYSTGGFLAASSQHLWPTATLETIAGVQYQTITATCRGGADDVQFIAESSSGLSGWTATPVFVRSVMNPDGTESVTWRAAQPWGSVPREMMRLRFVLQP